MKQIIFVLLILNHSTIFGQQCSCPNYEKNKKLGDELSKTDIQKAQGTYSLAGHFLGVCIGNSRMSNDPQCLQFFNDQNQNLRLLTAKLDNQNKKPLINSNNKSQLNSLSKISATVFIKRYSRSVIMPDKAEIINRVERVLATTSDLRAYNIQSSLWISNIEEQLYNFNYLNEDKEVFDSTSKIILSQKNINEQLLYEYLRSAMFYTWNLLTEKSDTNAIKKANQAIEQQINVIANSSKFISAQMLFAYSGFENLLSKYYQDNKDNINSYKHSLLAVNYGIKAVAIEPKNPFFLRGLFTYLNNMKYSSDSILLQNDKDRFDELAYDVKNFMKNNIDNKLIYVNSQVQCIINRTTYLITNKKYNEAISLLQQGISDISSYKSELNYSEYGPLNLARLDNELSSIYNAYNKDSVLYKKYTKKALDNFIQTLSTQITSQREIDKIDDTYTSISSNVNWTFNDDEKMGAYKSIITMIEKSDNDYLNLKNIAFIYVDANATLTSQLLKKKTMSDTALAITYVNNAVDIFNKSDFLKSYNGYSEDYARFCNIFDRAIELYAAQNNYIMAKKLF